MTERNRQILPCLDFKDWTAEDILLTMDLVVAQAFISSPFEDTRVLHYVDERRKLEEYLGPNSVAGFYFTEDSIAYTGLFVSPKNFQKLLKKEA